MMEKCTTHKVLQKLWVVQPLLLHEIAMENAPWQVGLPRKKWHFGTGRQTARCPPTCCIYVKLSILRHARLNPSNYGWENSRSGDDRTGDGTDRSQPKSYRFRDLKTLLCLCSNVSVLSVLGNTACPVVSEPEQVGKTFVVTESWAGNETDSWPGMGTCRLELLVHNNNKTNSSFNNFFVWHWKYFQTKVFQKSQSEICWAEIDEGKIEIERKSWAEVDEEKIEIERKR